MPTSTALDRGPRYYGTQLSENIIRTPDGFLICKNVPIARTGFQIYRVSELDDPDGLLGDRNTSEEIEVYRSPEEVFSPATLASFEGMSVTVSHPDKLLDPDNVRDHHVGHVQNVRRGTEPLDSGDIPMLGDIHIKDAEGIQAVDSGVREVSCGYSYQLAREGYRFEQRNIRGNHVAIVPNGRAGSEARINDAAMESEKKSIVKEKQPVSLRTILGLGIKEMAKDATPEQMAAAADEISKLGREPGTRSVATDAVAADAKKETKIVIPSESGEGKLVFLGKTDEGIRIFKQVAMDAEEEEKKDKVVEDATGDGKEAEAVAAKSKIGDEYSKKMHDALDRMIADSASDSEEEEEEEKGSARDADLGELKRLLNQYMGEEEKEDIHGDAAPCPDCGKYGDDCTCGAADEEEEEKADDKVETEKEEAETGDKTEEEAEDAAEIVRAEPVLGKEDLPKSAFDAKGTLTLLRALRPFVAKANNRKLNAAFDTTFRAVRRAAVKTGNGGGSHAKFRAAASHAKDSEIDERETFDQKEARKLDEKYAKILSDSRKRNTQISHPVK